MGTQIDHKWRGEVQYDVSCLDGGIPLVEAHLNNHACVRRTSFAHVMVGKHATFLCATSRRPPQQTDVFALAVDRH